MPEKFVYHFLFMLEALFPLCGFGKRDFDSVVEEVIRWAMRKLGVEEWLVSAVFAMYTGAKTIAKQFMVTVTVIR